MNQRDIRISKRLSWLLRHGADEAGLSMDPAGWVAVDEVLRRLRITQRELEHSVATNNKRRLQLLRGQVRCCQGHSTSGMPVTCEALEASWARHEGTGWVWHGTNLAALPAIDAAGLLPQRRTHVHLAEETDSTVGKRAAVQVVLAVDPVACAAAGFPLWRAPNGVLLTREVPRSCVVGVRALTRRAVAQSEALHARFGEA